MVSIPDTQAPPTAPTERRPSGATKPTKPYTGAITWLNVQAGHFEAQSSSDPTLTYSGNVLTAECSCPNATYRPGTACRHLQKARAEYWEALDAARTEATERAAHAGQQQWHTDVDASGWPSYWSTAPGTREGERR